jgi:hypothetical protein
MVMGATKNRHIKCSMKRNSMISVLGFNILHGNPSNSLVSKSLACATKHLKIKTFKTREVHEL